MANYRLDLSYDGTPFLGWQKTRMGPSVEEELEKALSTILQASIKLQAASRTDAGVHAIGQVVNFFSDDLNEKKVLNSLKGLLPVEIQVNQLRKIEDSFHPTLDNRGKIYRYYVCSTPIQLPHHRNYSWHCYDLLDLGMIHHAIPYFLGKRDFSSFCHQKQISTLRNPICELRRIELHEIKGGRLYFEVEGNRFLYKMVRTLVGTLIDIGRKRIDLKAVDLITRSDLGMTAPAHGLFLEQVLY